MNSNSYNILMKLKILDVKDPVLRKKSKTVKKIDKKITKLIADMKETLISQKDPEGIGLAAPQIGKNLRLFVVNYEDLQRVVINPKVLKTSKETIKTPKQLLEGCLSLPHYYGPIKRAKTIKIKYQNENGDEVTEEFNNFPAQIIQHELDHLDGTLFIDHILDQEAPLYKFKGEEWEEVELA